MKRSFLLVNILFLALFSQNLWARDLALALEQHYATLKNWRADFAQTTYIEVLDQNLTKQAQITVERPNKIRIEYFSDPKKIYITDGKKLWIYKNEDDNAWQFDNPSKVLSEEALSFLGGFQNLTALFAVSKEKNEFKGNLHIKDPKLSVLTLVPKQPDSNITKIILGVDENTLTVKESILYNASGNVTHYVFSKIQFDQRIDPVVFSLPREPKRKIIRK